jgi:hypothetical protein
MPSHKAIVLYIQRKKSECFNIMKEYIDILLKIISAFILIALFLFSMSVGVPILFCELFISDIYSVPAIKKNPTQYTFEIFCYKYQIMIKLYMTILLSCTVAYLIHNKDDEDKFIIRETIYLITLNIASLYHILKTQHNIYNILLSFLWFSLLTIINYFCVQNYKQIKKNIRDEISEIDEQIKV